MGHAATSENTGKNNTGTKKTALAGFAVLMIALGVSDSMRGIFSTIFQSHFQLTPVGLSTIMMVSYGGNLVFLLTGGRLMDRFERKKAFLAAMIIWMGALVLFLLSDSYPVLLVGMFFAMGASTLLSTTINLVTPLIFISSPGFVVNFLFFIQGIGTSGGQSLIGNLAKDFTGWKMVNGVLLAVGLLSFLLVSFMELPDTRRMNTKKEKTGKLLKSGTLWVMILAFGMYFIAEHGILNWFVVYGTDYLGLSKGRAADYLALFYGGITVGRLVFAPLVDKLGTFKSIIVFSLAASVLFVSGILSGSGAVWLMSVSGLFFSIIYPTLVMCIARLYPRQIVSTASGMIISIASLFDIGFNYVFGNVSQMVGYGTAFLIMPASMCLFVVMFTLFVIKRKGIEGGIA